jgi:hypothetical protein
MNSKSAPMSTFRSDAPDITRSRAIAIDEASQASLAALLALLKRENSSLYACGRAYLVNLTKWRDHFLGVNDHDHQLSTSCNVATSTSCLAITQPPLRNATPSTSAATSTLDAPGNKVRPDEHPEILLNWRTRVIAWYFDFIHSKNYEYNTALVALSYLDVYSMSVCFPGQDSSTATIPTIISGGTGCIATPSPSKKSKINHQSQYEERTEVDPTAPFHATESFDDSIQGLDIVHYRLAAVASLYLACKVFQSSPTIVTSSGFANAMGDGTASPKQVEDMELAILKVLSFRVHTPTALRFIHELLPLLIPRQSRNGSSLWVPHGDVEERIISDASMLATLASFCGAEKVPALISASPSKVALAAIIEATKRIFDRDERVFAQHAFLERLSIQQVVPYTDEVRVIQHCLVELKHTNEQKGDYIYSASTATHSSDTGYPSETSSNSSDITENIHVECTSKPKFDNTKDAITAYTAFRRTVSQSSDGDSPNKTSSKCSDGRIHRVWESVEQCISAANATSYYFAAEMDSVK